ncbi:MAG TPA: hypothetical protein DEQ09_00640, partial [Bacteroidales bacterium]|nr:hypothetical protein [Bacteroidales bacterium]
MQERLKYTVFLVSILISATLRGQDPHFSQFYANALYLAPSFTGAIE